MLACSKYEHIFFCHTYMCTCIQFLGNYQALVHAGMCHLSFAYLLSPSSPLLIDKYYFHILNYYVARKLISAKEIYKPRYSSLVTLDQGPTICHCKLVSSPLADGFQSIYSDPFFIINYELVSMYIFIYFQEGPCSRPLTCQKHRNH